MFKLFFVYLLFVSVSKIFCISLPQNQEIFVIKCIKQNKNSGHHSTMEKSKSRRCQQYLDPFSARLNTQKEDPGLANSTDEMLKYMAALLKWRHTDTRQDSNLLARVASCNSHSRTMRKYWKHFFLKRQKTVFSSVEIIDQAWNTKLGTINFRPSTLRYSSRNIVAAELIIARSSPNKIGELYGHYKTKVNVLNRDGVALQKVHSDSQSSCISLHGDLMLLDLNVNEVSRWHRDGMKNITLTIGVDSHRQYFNSTAQKVSGVVQEIIGIVVHFRRSQSEIERDNWEMRQSLLRNLERLRNKSIAKVKKNLYIDLPNSGARKDFRLQKRVRRSPGRRSLLIDRPRPAQSRKHCHLAPFKVEHEVLEDLVENFVYSIRYNINECIGVCQHPFPHHVNVTSHALVTNRHRDFNACCVPIQYEALPYVARRGEGSHATLTGADISNMVATKCGCR